jgi:hypothetical protein
MNPAQGPKITHFREIVAVYLEPQAQHLKTLCKLPEFLIGTYSRHCAVRDYLEFIVGVLESAIV